jgi:L-seryl-tRNA(Ser) seleniumtransferase
VSGIQAEPFTPEIANQTPHLRISWNVAQKGMTPEEVRRKLAAGEPSIEVVPVPFPNYIEVAVAMLEDGEVEVVARRLAEVLGG